MTKPQEMAKHPLKQRDFWNFAASRFPLIWNEEPFWEAPFDSSGLTVYETNNTIVVEVNLPGLSLEDIQVHYDQGYLMIDGAKKEEKKDKKYYRKAHSTFSYRVAIPGEVDENAEPEATFKNGIMTVEFKKAKAMKPSGKKISVKAR